MWPAGMRSCAKPFPAPCRTSTWPAIARPDKIVGLKILDKAKTDALEARFKGLKKPTEGEIASSFNHPRIVETLLRTA